jgi:hypothetical protein
MNVKSQLKSGFSLATLLGSAATAVVCGWLMSDPEQLRTDFIAEVDSPSGVFMRHATEIDWREVKQGEAFHGSLVEVPANSSAVLKVGQHQQEPLEAGSIVRVSQENGHTLTETALKRDARTGALEFRKTTEVGKTLGVDTAEVRLLTPLDRAHFGHQNSQVGRGNSEVLRPRSDVGVRCCQYALSKAACFWSFRRLFGASHQPPHWDHV